HARLVHLVRVDDEVLAQHRQRTGSARLAQVAVAALEEIDVGEHRQAGGAAGLVAAGDRGGVEIGPDQPLGRARLLDLGDDRRLATGVLAADRLDEAARRRRAGGAVADAVERADAAALLHLLVLAGEDALEDVGHAAIVPRVRAWWRRTRQASPAPRPRRSPCARGRC